MMPLGLIPQHVQDKAGLDPGQPLLRVQAYDPAHILRAIQHDGIIATLPRKTRPAAPREYRRAVAARHRNGADHVLRMPGNHDADRHLPIVRSVRGVERPAAVVKSHLAFDGGPESLRERLMINASRISLLRRGTGRLPIERRPVP